MRTKFEILKELCKNRQLGAFGGISPDTEKIILVEILIDIRDILNGQLMDIEKTTRERSETPL